MAMNIMSNLLRQAICFSRIMAGAPLLLPMLVRSLVLSLVLMLTSGCALTTDQGTSDHGTPGHGVSAFPDEIRQQAADYRRLRAQQGHFDGGVWSATLDQWQGEKHRLMQQLAAFAQQQGLTTTQLLILMGQPDSRRAEPEELLAPLIRRLFAEQFERIDMFQLYYWRGRHDVLYLGLAGERVIAARWLYMGE